MSLLNNLPHTVDHVRFESVRATTNDYGGDREEPHFLAQGLSCWVQNASFREITEFEKRDQRVTHRVMFASPVAARPGDAFYVRSGPSFLNQLLNVKAETDRSAGLGALFTFMCEEENNVGISDFFGVESSSSSTRSSSTSTLSSSSSTSSSSSSLSTSSTSTESSTSSLSSSSTSTLSSLSSSSSSSASTLSSSSSTVSSSSSSSSSSASTLSSLSSSSSSSGAAAVADNNPSIWLRADSGLASAGSSTATDSSVSGNDGTLTNMNAVGSWVSDTPHGSPEPTCFDDSGNNNHGTLTGFADVATARTTDVASGASGQSVMLDGTDDYVKLNTSATFTSNTAGTISAWIKPSNKDFFILGYSDSTSTTKRFAFKTDGNRDLNLEFIDLPTNNSVRYDTAIVDDVWTHVAVTSSGSTWTMYVNGAAVSVVVSGSNTGDWFGDITGLDNLNIAAWIKSGSDFYADGNIDDVRIYDTELSADQIAYIFEDHTGTPSVPADDPGTDNLQLHLTFDESNTRNLPAIGAGYALEFDGVDDYVDIGVGPSSVKSISFWINADDISTRKLIDIDGTDQIELDGSGNVTATSFPSATVYVNGIQSPGPLVVDTWNHVVITDSTGVNASNCDLARAGVSNEFDGTVDDVRFYDDVLTSDEIAYLYSEGAKGTDPTTTNLVGHWKFDDGPQSTTVVDAGSVVQWQDKTTNRHLFSQDTGANSPTYDEDGIGGKPAVLFDGTNDVLVLADAILSSSAGLVFIVLKATSNADNDYAFASSDEATADRHIAFGQMSSEYGVTQNDGGTADTVDGNTATTTNATIVMVASNGTAYEIGIDGNAETESADSGSNSGDWFGDVTGLDNVTIGALKSSSESNHYPGAIAEIIVFPEDKSAGVKADIVAYLKKRYSIA